MDILITGSNGFIGNRLTAELKRKKHNIVELDLAGGFDILDYDSLIAIDRFDICIHLAARTFVPDSFNHPLDFFNTNVNGLMNIVELCRVNKAKLIFPSSYVYGTPNYLPIDEEHPISAHNPYSETKIISERIISSYNKFFGLHSLIFRPFNIYGPKQSENFLIPKIFAQAANGKVVLNDHRPKRDFVYIEDVVNAFLLAVENNSWEFEIFNIGSGISYSVSEVFDEINQIFNNSLEIEYLNNERPGEVLEIKSDIGKIESKLGWKPRYSLVSGLKKVFESL